MGFNDNEFAFLGGVLCNPATIIAAIHIFSDIHNDDNMLIMPCNLQSTQHPQTNIFTTTSIPFMLLLSRPCGTLPMAYKIFPQLTQYFLVLRPEFNRLSQAFDNLTSFILKFEVRHW